MKLLLSLLLIIASADADCDGGSASVSAWGTSTCCSTSPWKSYDYTVSTSEQIDFIASVVPHDNQESMSYTQCDVDSTNGDTAHRCVGTSCVSPSRNDCARASNIATPERICLKIYCRHWATPCNFSDVEFTGTVAKIADGGDCTSSSSCASGSCKGGKCCGTKGMTTGCQKCDYDGDCIKCGTGFTLSNYACFPALKTAGASCTTNSSCASGSCKGGKCCGTKGKTTGCTACMDDGDCKTCAAGYQRVNSACVEEEEQTNAGESTPSSGGELTIPTNGVAYCICSCCSGNYCDAEILGYPSVDDCDECTGTCATHYSSCAPGGSGKRSSSCQSVTREVARGAYCDHAWECAGDLHCYDNVCADQLVVQQNITNTGSSASPSLLPILIGASTFFSHISGNVNLLLAIAALATFQPVGALDCYEWGQYSESSQNLQEFDDGPLFSQKLLKQNVEDYLNEPHCTSFSFKTTDSPPDGLVAGKWYSIGRPSSESCDELIAQALTHQVSDYKCSECQSNGCNDENLAGFSCHKWGCNTLNDSKASTCNDFRSSNRELCDDGETVCFSRAYVIKAHADVENLSKGDILGVTEGGCGKPDDGNGSCAKFKEELEEHDYAIDISEWGCSICDDASDCNVAQTSSVLGEHKLSTHSSNTAKGNYCDHAWECASDLHCYDNVCADQLIVKQSNKASSASPSLLPFLLGAAAFCTLCVAPATIYVIKNRREQKAKLGNGHGGSISANRCGALSNTPVVFASSPAPQGKRSIGISQMVTAMEKPQAEANRANGVSEEGQLGDPL